MKIISENRKAKFEYFIEKKYIAGIVLFGNEVKSIKKNKISIKESYIKIIENEVFLINCTISKLEETNSFYEINEKRNRKLLLNKREIKHLKKELSVKGKTIIPLKIFLNENNLIKLEIGLGKGKKIYDKRQDIKEKDLKRRKEDY